MISVICPIYNEEKYIEKYNAKIVDVPMAPIDISSTELREKIKLGEDTSLYIPHNVRTYIDKYNMYR